MKTESYAASFQEIDRQASLADTLTGWQKTCNQCKPLTPMMCLTSCKIWKQKNEFRKLYRIIKTQSFMTNLLNTLKNNRRLQILEIISKGRYSTARLQQELKNQGYYHSQQTIAEEYVTPLLKVGLVEENQKQYGLTLFGRLFNKLLKNFHGIADALPPHSECYEETALGMLLDKPKIYEGFEGIIPAKTVARVLNRLKKSRLIDTAKENDYVFYFRTKRDSNKTKLSPTERRVYENIPVDGIPARKLAEKTGISSRRTYKYLKKLKGKKLIFARKKPKSYALTVKGFQIASILKRIHELVVEVLATASQITNDERTYELPMLDTYQTKGNKKEKNIAPLTTI